MHWRKLMSVTTALLGVALVAGFVNGMDGLGSDNGSPLPEFALSTDVYALECPNDGGGGDQGDRPECERGEPGGGDTGCSWRFKCWFFPFFCWAWVECPD